MFIGTKTALDCEAVEHNVKHEYSGNDDLLEAIPEHNDSVAHASIDDSRKCTQCDAFSSHLHSINVDHSRLGPLYALFELHAPMKMFDLSIGPSHEQSFTEDDVKLYDLRIGQEDSDEDPSQESLTDDNVGGINLGKESFSPSNLTRVHERYDPAAQNGDLDDLLLPAVGKRVLLLYLNSDTFLNNQADKLADVVKAAKEEGIDTILVHEQDIDRGSCPFSLIMENTPEELIYPPFNIFRDIAIPLYTRDEYRRISLRLILQKMRVVGDANGRTCFKFGSEGNM